jgi:hypothetical protein
MLGIYLNIKLNNFLGVIFFPMYGTVVTVNFWRLLPLHGPTICIHPHSILAEAHTSSMDVYIIWIMTINFFLFIWQIRVNTCKGCTFCGSDGMWLFSLYLALHQFLFNIHECVITYRIASS